MKETSANPYLSGNADLHIDNQAISLFVTVGPVALDVSFRLATRVLTLHATVIPEQSVSTEQETDAK